jgi:hypothetical protein
MTVSYILKPSDYVSLSGYVYLHDPGQRNKLLGGALLVLAGVFITQRASGAPWQNALGFAGLMTLFYAAFIWLATLSKVRAAYRGAPSGFHAQEITLSDEGIAIFTKALSQKTAWDTIVKVCRDSNAIYLFISSRMAFLIPLRAFSSRRDIDAFIAYASERQGGTPR